jgi:hypothetical protein
LIDAATNPSGYADQDVYIKVRIHINMCEAEPAPRHAEPVGDRANVVLRVVHLRMIT